MKEIKSHSDLVETFTSQIPGLLRENFRKVARAERARVAELVQVLSDGSEDPVQKNILEEVATAVRRMPDVY